MRHAATLAFVLAVTACSNDSHHMTTVGIDAPGMGSGSAHIDAPPQQGGPNVVDLQLFGDPDLIEYRDGAGPWIVPSLVGQNYELHVTDDYQVVIACSSTGLAGNEDSEQLNATVGDGPNQFMFCQSGSSGTAPTTYAVTGQMQQAGTVILGDVTKSSNTAAWSFSLDVAMGTHDLVAFDAAHMLITRDIAVNAAVALPTVDVAANGTPATRATITLTGLGAGDTVQTQSVLYTQNDYVLLSQTTNNTAEIVPDALLQQTDFTELFARATNTAAGTYRSVRSYSNATTFTLPAVLTGVTFGTAAPVTAHWGTLPAASTVLLQAYATTTTNFTIQSVTATQAWLTKAGATSLAFASDAANYNSAWNVDPASAYLAFEIDTDSQDGGASSGIESSPPIAQLTARVQHERRMIARRRHSAN